MNQNTEIRQAIANLLRETGSDYNIFDSRFLKIPSSKLPAISVYTMQESVEYTRDAEAIIRTPQVVVCAYATGLDAVETDGESVDEKMDVMLSFIESKLFTKFQTLDKQVYWLRYVGMKIDVNIDQENLTLIGQTFWEARYHDSF